MTIDEIAKTIAFFLRKSYSGFDVTGAAGVNLVYLALNNARKHAEKIHDFSACRQKGYLSVTTKVDWTAPTWFEGGSEAMRKGKNWWLRTGGTVGVEFSGADMPIKVVGFDTLASLERRESYDVAISDHERRYMSDSTANWDHPLLGQTYGVRRGKWLELYPTVTSAQTVIVDGYKWWGDWGPTSGADAKAQIYVAPTSALYTALTEGSILHIGVIEDDGTEASIYLELDNSNDGSLGVIAVDGLIVDTYFNATDVAAACVAAGFDAAAVGGLVRLRSNDAGGPPVSVFWELFDENINLIARNQVYGVGSNMVEDWWTTYGAEYLIARGIVEANRLSQMFVGNKEGNLPPPTKEADAALQLLIQNDIDAENGGEIQQF